MSITLPPPYQSRPPRDLSPAITTAPPIHRTKPQVSKLINSPSDLSFSNHYRASYISHQAIPCAAPNRTRLRSSLVTVPSSLWSMALSTMTWALDRGYFRGGST
jgi:hypothetical protein